MMAAGLVCLAATAWLGFTQIGAHRAGAQPVAEPAIPMAPAAPPATAALPAGIASPPAPVRPTERSQVREAVAQRIDALQRRLKITPAEQPLWDEFAGTMLRNALDSEARFHAVQSPGTLGAADGMEARARAVAAHAEMLQRLSESFRPLYEAMSADQRQTADQVFRQAQRQEGRQSRATSRAMRE